MCGPRATAASRCTSVSGRPVHEALGTVANKQGRAGWNQHRGRLRHLPGGGGHRGHPHPELEIGRTGLTETRPPTPASTSWRATVSTTRSPVTCPRPCPDRQAAGRTRRWSAARRPDIRPRRHGQPDRRRGGALSGPDGTATTSRPRPLVRPAVLPLWDPLQFAARQAERQLAPAPAPERFWRAAGSVGADVGRTRLGPRSAAMERGALRDCRYRAGVHPEPLRARTLRGGPEGGGRTSGWRPATRGTLRRRGPGRGVDGQSRRRRRRLRDTEGCGRRYCGQRAGRALLIQRADPGCGSIPPAGPTGLLGVRGGGQGGARGDRYRRRATPPIAVFDGLRLGSRGFPFYSWCSIAGPLAGICGHPLEARPSAGLPRTLCRSRWPWWPLAGSGVQRHPGRVGRGRIRLSAPVDLAELNAPSRPARDPTPEIRWDQQPVRGQGNVPSVRGRVRSRPIWSGPLTW